MNGFRLETDRLVLRAWREEDIAPFHAICSDPEVMATLGPPLSRDETAVLVARMQVLQDELGHCFWALERPEDARLIGWCGVIRGSVGPVEGKPEIGWRMARDTWGQGFASEAARACVAWAFANLADDTVCAITSVGNQRSRAVMERIGMTYVEGADFDHPAVPQGDPLVCHVLYRMPRSS